MKNKVMSSLLLGIILFGITGCFKDNTEIVKKGSLSECSAYTIEDLVDAYMDHPEWERLKSDKGYYVYNVTGETHYQIELSKMLIQFAFDDDEIVIKEFEIDKVSQDSSLIPDLEEEMCKIKEAKNGKSEVLEDVPITILYNDDAYVINKEDIPKAIDLKIIGSKKEIERFKENEKDYKITVDLTDYKASDTTYKINLTYLNDEYDLLYKGKPSYIKIKIDDKVSEVFTITSELRNKDAVQNVKNIEIFRQEVVIKGSESALKSIKRVKAIIDLSVLEDKDAGYYELSDVALVAYDESDKIINNVEIVPKTTDIGITLGNN